MVPKTSEIKRRGVAEFTPQKNADLMPNAKPAFQLGLKNITISSPNIMTSNTNPRIESGGEFCVTDFQRMKDFTNQDCDSPARLFNIHKKGLSMNSAQTHTNSKRISNNSSIMKDEFVTNEDFVRLQSLISNCDEETKKIDRQKNQLTKKKNGVKHIFNQFKNRVQFNLEVNKQESLPEDMLDIKYYRFQTKKEVSLLKGKEEREHLEELAQKYSRWKMRLDVADMHKLKETI